MSSRQASHGFTIRPVPPFRLDLTVWALRRRSRNLIDRWDGTTYRRVIVLGGRPTELAVRQVGSSATPMLSITATPPPRTPLERRRVRSVAGRLLGVRIDLTDWYEMAAGDPRLRSLADTFRGMKPPRFPTMFEALVNAFACQQLSLEVGLELLNRLATISGASLGSGGDARYAFPTPRDVARLSPEKCQAIGFSHQKVRALLGLASKISGRERDLELLQQENDAVVQRRLLELRGVGRWTAEYVLLRGVNDAEEHARELVSLLKGSRSKVNLIPLNPAPEIPFEAPRPESVDRFCAILADAHITVSVRRPRGQDILAACGQLHLKRAAAPASAPAAP